MRQLGTLSIYGLYQFQNNILDGLVLPAEVDRDTLISNLLMESVDREVVYPNPDVLAFAISRYSKMRLPVWEHLAETLHYEYNPIHNYDRTEFGDETFDEQSGSERNNNGNETGHGSTTGNVDTTNNAQSGHESTNTETRDLHSTDSGTENTTEDMDYTRNLHESSTGKETYHGTEDVTGTMNSTANAQDSGNDVHETEKAAYNNQTGTPLIQRDTTKYGKGTKTTTDQNSTNNTVADHTTDTTGSLAQTGTTGEDKTTDTSYSKTGSDTGTVKNVLSENSISKETGNQQSTGSYTDNKDTTFHEIENAKRENQTEHRLRAYGNIGVTTTQALIEEERRIAEFNIMEYIIHDLLNKFCLLVY